MCYAFHDVVKANVELVRDEIHRREDVGPFPYPVAEPKSQKRSAVTDIEERPAKVAKCSIDLVFESSAEAEELSAQEAVEQQKKDLRDELAKSKTQVSNLKEEVQDLKEQNGDLLDELFVFRAAQEQQGQKAKAGSSDGKDLKKLAVKKAREAWKAEENKRVGKLKTTCQKNIDDARERFEKRIELRDEKHEDLIAAKDQACKKKVEEYKAKNLQLEQETKDTKQEFAQLKKDLKLETEKTQKDLKEEQHRAIKAWKPEHSKAVKEKDDQLRENSQKIKELRTARDRFKELAEKLQNEFKEVTTQKEKLETDLEENNTELEKCKKLISDKHESLLSSTETNQELINGYNTKLANEGAKWKLQYDRAEKYAKERHEMHRENFNLRQVFNKATKRIKDLETQLTATTEHIQRLTSPKEESVEKVEVVDDE